MLARSAPGLSPAAIVLVALSLSIGWGVRGNWGHEFGAMIPGALAALAAALCSGREDWYRRAPYFAFFGALGWSFGGTISYMQVIGYTHNGEHAGSVLYVIFLWWVVVGNLSRVLPFQPQRLITEGGDSRQRLPVYAAGAAGATTHEGGGDRAGSRLSPAVAAYGASGRGVDRRGGVR